MSPRPPYKPPRPSRSQIHASTFGDFTCVHCGRLVIANPRLAGVQNRNHCPSCLYSRHLDAFEGGDRLSACLGPMAPIGLTLKKTHKKYARPGQGELMLIHQCESCRRLSLNRIAADDDSAQIEAVFAASQALDSAALARLAAAGIDLLGPAEADLVKTQLYGRQE